jgi:hypothetical protein
MTLYRGINSITLTGNLGADPTVQTSELNGKAMVVVDFSIAVYGGKLDRTKDASRDNTFSKWIYVRFRSEVGGYAEDVANSLKKGDRVTVIGRPGFFIRPARDSQGNALTNPDGSRKLADHTNQDNIMMNVEGSDIVLHGKDPNAGAAKHDGLPPLPF